MEKDKEQIEEEINESHESQDVDDSKEDNIDETISENNNEDVESKEEGTNETEVDILKEEIKTLKEEKIRVLAEMENLRKRFEREKIDSIKYGSAGVVTKHYFNQSDIKQIRRDKKLKSICLDWTMTIKLENERIAQSKKTIQNLIKLISEELKI